MTTMVESTEHLHARPAWNCRVCGEPWPCASARANLLAEFHGFPSVLSIYLSSQMYDALGDLYPYGKEAPELYERFMSWVHESDLPSVESS